MRPAMLFVIAIPFLLSSCAVHSGLTANLNQNTTQVVLSGDNFRVIERVQGQSQAVYVFGIGGLARSALIAEARAQMLSQVNLVGTSRAVINESVAVTYTMLPIIRRHTVTVTAHIIEFTE